MKEKWCRILTKEIPDGHRVLSHTTCEIDNVLLPYNSFFKVVEYIEGNLNKNRILIVTGDIEEALEVYKA